MQSIKVTYAIHRLPRILLIPDNTKPGYRRDLENEKDIKTKKEI
jgi:hypothetical protein